MLEFVQQGWRAAFEIFLLSVVIYFILRFIRGTRGSRVLIGLASLLLVITLLSQIFDLRTIQWILRHFFTFFVVALLVIFQPELRRALAEVGSQPIFFTTSNELALVNTLVKTCQSFSSKRVGAIIALEREIGLRGYAETEAESGVMVDALLSQEPLEQLFYPNSPLHDGGVVIQNDRVMAAACLFPLSQRANLAKSMGTRHRAALGLSEETDAIVLVVSEETGNISVATHGTLHSNLDSEKLRALLTRLIVGLPQETWLGRLQNLLQRRLPIS